MNRRQARQSFTLTKTFLFAIIGILVLGIGNPSTVALGFVPVAMGEAVEPRMPPRLRKPTRYFMATLGATVILCGAMNLACPATDIAIVAPVGVILSLILITRLTATKRTKAKKQ